MSLFAAGKGYAAVAQELGFSVYTVRDWARAYRAGHFNTNHSPTLKIYPPEVRARVVFSAFFSRV